jgi:hypothetical protein
LNGDGCISRGELAEVVQAVHELMGKKLAEDDKKTRDQVRFWEVCEEDEKLSGLVDGVGLLLDGVGLLLDGVGLLLDGVGLLLDGVGLLLDGFDLLLDTLEFLPSDSTFVFPHHSLHLSNKPRLKFTLLPSPG